MPAAREHPVRCEVQFRPDQMDALRAAAVRDGVPTAVWVREAALDALARKGYRLTQHERSA